MKQIVLKSFTDFLMVRTVANKYGFRKHIQAEKTEVAQLFLSEIRLVFDSNKVSQMQQAERQLRREGITLAPCTLPSLTPTTQTAPIKNQMQTFDQLTATIFRSRHNCCMLMVDLPSQATVLKEIHQNLFASDENFSIERAEKRRNDTYAGDWFFIKHKGSAVPDGQPVFHCEGLIKPNLALRLNLRKAVKIYNNLQNFNANLEVYISEFTILAQTTEHFLKIDDLMAMYIQMRFKTVEDLIQTLRMIYRHGFKDCLEFLFPEEEGPSLQYHDFVQIYPTLSNRITKFEEDFNVSFRNHNPKRSQPPKPINQQQQQAEAPISQVQNQLRQNQALISRVNTQMRQNQRVPTRSAYKLQGPNYINANMETQDTPLSKDLKTFLPNKILQPAPRIDQQPEYVEAIRIKMILLQGKHRDILALQEEWPAISEFFTELINNWSINHTYVVDFLKTIIKIMDYRLHKFRMPLPKQSISYQRIIHMTEDQLDAKVKSSFFYLNTHIYPKMREFVQKFGQLLNMKTIKDKAKEKYSEYKKTAKSEEQKLRQRQQGMTLEVNAIRSYGLKEKKERLEDRFQQYNKILNIILQDCRKDLGKLGYEENVLDKLMLDYFAELQSISKGKGYFYVKIEGFQKKELREFIGEIIGFQEKFFEWQDVFNIIVLNINPDRFIGNGVEKLLNNVNTTVYSDTSCLGCAQYFVLNRSIINKHNRIPLRVFSQGSIGKRLRGQFMEDVCTMLNNSGGIILFNCNKYYGSVLPKGAYLTNRDKTRYTEEIEEMIDQIYPKVYLDKQIVVSFVPIVIKSESKDAKTVLNQHEQAERKGQYYEGFSKIEGFYIMRIKIVPQHKSKVYIWGREEGQYNLNGVTNQYKKLKINQLYRAIKLKLSQYPQVDDKATSFRPKTYGNPLSHQCKVIKEEAKKEDSQNTNILQNLERRYKFISMIVVKEQNISKIDTILKDQGFDIFIKPVFQEYRFGIAKYTAALFHNEAFSEILQFFINCKELVFDGKRVLSIFITDYLKIDTGQGLNSTDIKNACEWLKKEFPYEEMKYYQTKPLVTATPKAYYVKTQTKLSTLFMYYVFNHYKIKTVFKNPPNPEMDKLQSIKLQECD